MSEIKQPQLQVLDVLTNFNFHPKVSGMVLRAYCERKGYEPLSENDYRDHLFQYQHDQRAKAIIPKIIELLAQYQYPEDYINSTKKEEIRKNNDALEQEIARICAENGVVWREVDSLLKEFGEVMNAMMTNTANRINNMCSRVVSTIAQDQFGEEMPVKSLEDWHEERVNQFAQ